MHPYIIPGIKRSTLSKKQRSDLAKDKQKDIAIIFSAVCNYYQLKPEGVKGKCRSVKLVEARQVYCYMCKLYTKASLKEIASLIGNRDHTTAIHSIQQAHAHIKMEPEFRQNVLALEVLIENMLYGGTISSGGN